MATRTLTDVFMLMRNNAIQNRHIYAESVSSFDVQQFLTTPLACLLLAFQVCYSQTILASLQLN